MINSVRNRATAAVSKRHTGQMESSSSGKAAASAERLRGNTGRGPVVEQKRESAVGNSCAEANMYELERANNAGSGR